jgi:hypothetical protein
MVDLSRTASPDLLSVVTSAAYVTDPYPFLAELRERTPVLNFASNLWAVSRYADVAHGMRDQALSCDFAALDSYSAYFRARGIDDRFPLPLNALDPPDHRRIRSVVGREFLPRVVEQMRPLVEATVEEVLDDLVASGRSDIDLVHDVAFPVPVAIIGKLFGLDPADRRLLQEWSEAFGAVSDPDPLLSDEQRRAAADATREAGAYFGRLLLSRRGAAGDDLMSRWLETRRLEHTMSVAEILVNGVFLLIVGHHNTVSLICNGLHALFEHPGELQRVRRDPALVPSAVEEMLRYDAPVQTSTRVTLEPYEVGGVVIPRRQQVMFLIGAANRDPQAFEEPDRFDVTRAQGNRNLGFGRGIHSCIGAELARLEVGITLGALLRRFPAIAPAGTVRRRTPCFTLRGMTSFPVRLGPAASDERVTDA